VCGPAQTKQTPDAKFSVRGSHTRHAADGGSGDDQRGNERLDHVGLFWRLSGVATGAGATGGALPGPDTEAKTLQQRMGSSNQHDSALPFAEPATW
jgi:hypothetical protein